MDTVRTLLDCPQDVLVSIAEALLCDDAGTLALALLCSTCNAFRRLRVERIMPLVSKLSLDFCRAPLGSVPTLEHYAVLAALFRVGGTNLTFVDAGVDVKPGRSMLKIEVMARLLRRHSTLVAHIEGHAGMNAPDRAATGFSQMRAKRVGVLLAAKRCPAGRMRMRGWSKTVSRAAQWPSGAPSRRADVFFTLGRTAIPALYLPPRPAYYADAHEASDSSVVPVDRFFFDEVAQELMSHSKLQSAFRSLHGLPMEERSAVMAGMVQADAELADLFATLQECAGQSVSVARGEPSAEELRVARYVHMDD